jgi:hypothetical protein
MKNTILSAKDCIYDYVADLMKSKLEEIALALEKDPNFVRKLKRVDYVKIWHSLNNFKFDHSKGQIQSLSLLSKQPQNVVVSVLNAIELKRDLDNFHRDNLNVKLSKEQLIDLIEDGI